MHSRSRFVFRWRLGWARLHGMMVVFCRVYACSLLSVEIFFPLYIQKRGK
jgi:hypothetical protein